MAEENKNEKKRSRGVRLLALMLTSPVNTLFILALAYYAFQIYVLNNSPLLNKAIMLGIACLWILWFAAKNLIKLLLLLILAGTAVYGSPLPPPYTAITAMPPATPANARKTAASGTKKAKPAKKKPAGCSKFRNWSNNI